MHDQAQALLDLLARSKRVTALTGAGVSTEAGIPDFRSEGGLWDRYDPMEVFSLAGFKRKPSLLYEVGEDLRKSLLRAQPTAAHLLLAKLEEQGKLQKVITQNIDGLHQRAGSSRVLELHGTLQTATALGSGKQYSLEEITERIAAHGIPPRCTEDGSLIKPDIVLFGEMLPHAIHQEAIAEARECDCFLVLGSSLVVSPAADLPGIALDHGAELAILNLQPTYYDQRAHLVLPYKLGDLCSLLIEGLGAA